MQLIISFIQESIVFNLNRYFFGVTVFLVENFGKTINPSRRPVGTRSKSQTIQAIRVQKIQSGRFLEYRVIRIFHVPNY